MNLTRGEMRQMAQRTYKTDRIAADQFIPQVKKILLKCHKHFLDFEVADDHLDQTEATDLVAVRSRCHIAVRIRDISYLEKEYHYDVTMRNHRPSGMPTEADKILSGFGDWMFYGWQNGTEIVAFVLLCLKSIRQSGLIEHKREIEEVIPNKDGSSDFITLGIPQLLDHKAIAASGNVLHRLARHHRRNDLNRILLIPTKNRANNENEQQTNETKT